MGFSEKTVLEQTNNEQRAWFPRSNRKTHTIYPTGWIPRVKYAYQAITLTKQRYKLAGKNSIEFIHEEKHKKDTLAPSQMAKTEEEATKILGPAESFVWHTTQKNIREAIFNGVMKVDAPTAKVINELGYYRLKVFDRAYAKGIISNKHEQKNRFLQLTQERIEKLQGLERLINNYDFGATIDENRKRINAVFQEYIDDLKQLRDHYKTFEKTLNQYDDDAYAKVYLQINKDIEAAKSFMAHLKRLSSNNKLSKNYLAHTTLAATGRNSLMTFIRNRMVYAVRQLQEHNQNMTYSFSAKSFLRGDLNSICENALKIVFDYKADAHNHILPEHQGIFSTNPNDERTIDYSHYNLSADERRHTLMAIAQIEGLDKITPTVVDPKSGYQQYILQSNGKKKSLYTTRLTKWKTNASASFIAKRTLAWVWNVLSGIVVGICPDLFIGFFGGLFNLNPPCLAEKIRWNVENDRNIQTKFHELEAKVRLPMKSLGTKLGRLVGNFIRNTFFELFRGIRIVLEDLKLDIFEGIKVDFKHGHNGIPDEVDIIKQVETEIEEMQKKREKSREKIIDEIKAFRRSATDSTDGHEKNKNVTPLHPLLISKKEVARIAANTPYELSHGEWHDLLNSVTNGVEIFLDSFTHEIHTKHPFTGFMFNLFYWAGGLAVMAPSWVAFLGPKYLAFSNALGGTVGKSIASKAMSSALYQAQMVATGINFVTDGTESWLANLVMTFEEDPSNIVLYCGLAVGIGALIAFKLNIPYISAEIRDDLGTMPVAALGFAGAKIGLLLYELLESDETKPDHTQTKKDIEAKLRLVYQDAFKGDKKLSDQQVDAAIKELTSEDTLDNLRQLQEDAKRAQFIMKLERNKTLLPHLNHETKRDLIESTTQQFPDNPEMRNAMIKMLFPEKSESILAVTLKTIFGYIPMIFRCLASTVTWSKEPWRQLWEKLKKDVGRVVYLVSRIYRATANFIKIMLRGICDIFLNEIVARLEGLFRNTKHTISRGSYHMSGGFDTTYVSACETFGTPVDLLKKSSTSPHSSKLIRYYLTNNNVKYRPVQSAKDTDKELKHLNAAKGIDFKSIRANIRTSLSSKKSRYEFFSENSLFLNGVLNDANDNVKALRGNRFNYEIISDIIRSNNKLEKPMKYSANQLIQLIVLDKTGRLARDVLNNKLGRSVRTRLLTKPKYLAKIIDHFYHVHDVLSALRLNKDSREDFFKNALDIYMKNTLYKTDRSDDDILEAIAILTRLLLTRTTQKATSKYLLEGSFTWKKCLSEVSKTTEAAQNQFRELVKELSEEKSFMSGLSDKITNISLTPVGGAVRVAH